MTLKSCEIKDKCEVSLSPCEYSCDESRDASNPVLDIPNCLAYGPTDENSCESCKATSVTEEKKSHPK